MEKMSQHHRAKINAAKTTTAALVVIALLIPAALLAFSLSPQAQAQEFLWLKIVTNAWKGKQCPTAALPNTVNCPPDDPLNGFADRYNATNTYVELYFNLRLRVGTGAAPIWDEAAGPFYPNATGFVQIPWVVPRWDN